MRKVGFFVWCICMLLFLAGCGKSNKHAVVFVDDAEVDSVPSADDSELQGSGGPETFEGENGAEATVSVPFEMRGGVKTIEVSINGEFKVPMILDSGCSTTLISIAEARYLYEKGCFSPDDILGVTQSQIADGSIVENTVINLREIVIGDQIVCPNVKATVSDNGQAPLLLGNEILDGVASYSVDNENQRIVFKMKAQ